MEQPYPQNLSAEISQFAEQYHLGELRTIYQPDDSFNLRILLLFIAANAIAVALMILLFFLGIVIYDLVLLFVPIITIIILIRAFSTNPGTIYVFEQGLLHVKRTPEVLSWESIQVLYRESSFRIQNPLLLMLCLGGGLLLGFLFGFIGLCLLLVDFLLGALVYQAIGPNTAIERNDKYTCRLNKRLRNVETLQSTIEQAITPLLLAKVLEAYHTQQSVSFGRLLIEGEKMTFANRTALWRDTERVEVLPRRNALKVIQRGGKHKIWRMPNTHNIMVAAALANTILRTK